MIAIIDYGAGNVRSVQNALKRLNTESILTRDESVLKSAEKVLFPGVGAAGSAMQQLRETGLDKLIPTLEQPVLGICLGQQLMCSSSEENNVECLGIFEEKVLRFPDELPVPHMGWNTLTNCIDWMGEFNDVDSYFVHSYYVPVGSSTVAEGNYMLPFSAAMRKNNFYATQFHPEKSGSIGEAILNQFLAI